MKIKKGQAMVIGAALVVGLGITAYAFKAGTKPAAATSVAVGKTDLQEEVESSGTVRAAQDVELAFQKSGRVLAVYAASGQAVTKGQLIASLDDSDLAAQLQSAEAALQTQQLKLQGLDPQSAAGSDAQTSIANNRANLVDKITDGYIKLDTAITANVDPLFSDPATNPDFGKAVSEGSSQYSISADTNTEFRINNERAQLTTLMGEWNSLDQSLSGDAAVSAASSKAIETLTAAQALLTDIASALNIHTGADATYQGVLATYVASVATARANVDTALTNIRTAEQAYASANAPVSAYSVQLQQTSVQGAQAQVDAVNAAIAQSSIRAPFDGVITEQDAKVGQIASPGAPVVHVISGDKLQIETYVSEADIGKISVGMAANVTLDPYGPQKSWTATVASVDAGETVVNGSNAYKVVLQFDRSDPLVKSGMGANVHFEISSKTGVVAVPAQAIIRKDDASYVTLDKGNGIQEQHPVVTGITGSNGYVEIVSGLSAGDRIVTFTTK